MSMFVGGGYNPQQVYAGAYAGAGMGGCGTGAYGYQMQGGVAGMLLGCGNYGGYGNCGGYGGYGGFGGSCGVGSMSGYYLGSQVSYTQFGLPGHRQPAGHFGTVTEQQTTVTNKAGKMWDVWFDHKDGQKTEQRSPIVLDLNNNGKPDITGKNVTGNGKIDGATANFDIDPSRDTYQYKSLQRRPGNGAPKVKGAKWVTKDGHKLYVDKDGNTIGELKKTGKGGKEEYHWGKKVSEEKTEWLAKNGGDGLLVWDVDNDGKITSSKELFSEFDTNGVKKFANGYEKLAHYFDKNQDGKVEGDELKGLQIWKDADADGKVDKGELEQLSKYNINSFDVKGYDKKTMEGSYNTQTSTTTEVQRQAFFGFSEQHYRQLVGFQNNFTVNQFAGVFGGSYGWGNFGGFGGFGGGYRCW